MNTQRDMESLIPSMAKRFKDADASGAYNSLYVHEDSLYLQGVWIMGVLYIYQVTIQGNGPAAAWFNQVIEHSLNALVGTVNYYYYTRFVDDLCVWGVDDAQVENRHKILTAAMAALGFDMSDKNKDVVRDYGNCAGIKFTKDGISINDDGINTLKLALDKKPKTMLECKGLIGSVLYAHTAFEWRTDDLSWFARMLQPMHTASAAAIDERGKRLSFVWTPECEANRKELLTRLVNQPRWFTHFNELVTDSTCLYILSDSCDTGGGVSLHWVKIPDARDVIPEEHLRDPEMSKLLNVKFRCFSEKTQRLPTFELEYTMAHLGCVEWGNLITTLTLPYPPGDDLPCKIGIGTDSSVGASIMQRKTKSLVYDIPPEPIPFVNARAKRMLDMADSIAYTAYWPLTVRHTAGRSNSLCDLISRIASQLKVMAAEAKQTKAVLCPLRIHSYHHDADGESTPVNTDMIYKGLCLTGEQQKELVRAYIADMTIYKKVHMCDIYRGTRQPADLKSMPPAVAERVAAWTNKRFFIKDDILWTPASNMQFREGEYITHHDGASGEDAQIPLHKVLVMVIPVDANVCISMPGHTCQEDSHDEVKEQSTLQHNLMWIAHEGAMHASVSEMQIALRKTAWYANMHQQCKRHVQMCSVCIQRQMPAAGIGLATGSERRMASIQFDHCVLDPVIRHNTGIWAVLTISDIASGTIALPPARTKAASETAYLLFTRWINLYGVPIVICSDADAGYAGKVMSIVTSMLGVSHHHVSARAQKGTAAHSERANAYVRKAERCMIAAGNASTMEQVTMYMSMAEIMANQQTTKDGHTSFERMYGQSPLTVMDLIAPSVFPNAGMDGLKEIDSSFIRSIADVTQKLTDHRNEMADHRSREAAAEADVQRHGSRATLFDLRPGDKVSYAGNSHDLVELTGPDDGPISAMVRDPNGKLKKVQYTQIRPLGVSRPVISLPLIGVVAEMRFVLADRDDEICAGKVLRTLDDFSVKVHLYEANVQMSRWLPLWSRVDHEPQLNEDAVRAKNPPSTDFQPVVEVFFQEEITAAGQISQGGVLSENLQEVLANNGLQ